MSRILSFPNFGRMKVYDLNNRVDMTSIRQDFKTLPVEKQAITHFQHKKPYTFTRLTDNILYPEYLPSDVIQIARLLQIYTNVADVHGNGTLSIEAQRITCTPGQNNTISCNEWKNKTILNAGIMCVNQCNIQGGIYEFNAEAADNEQNKMSLTLRPGQMVVFDSNEVQHHVTPIASKNGKTGGYRDILFFSFQ